MLTFLLTQTQIRLNNTIFFYGNIVVKTEKEQKKTLNFMKILFLKGYSWDCHPPYGAYDILIKS